MIYPGIIRGDCWLPIEELIRSRRLFQDILGEFRTHVQNVIEVIVPCHEHGHCLL